jgi:hypothetical protein
LTWIALAGLGYYLARNRLRPETVAPLTLVVFLPRGAGVLVVLPTATFTAYFAQDLAAGAGAARLRAAAAGTAAICAIAVIAVTVAGWAGGIGSLRAARAARASATQQADLAAGAWLRAHAGGDPRGQVLMELSGNEAVAFAVPPGQVVDETSSGLWQPALRDPLSRGIRWIYMRRDDDVWDRLHGSAGLSRYALVYSGPDRLVYERTSA